MGANSRDLIEFCRGLFCNTNLIGTDIDDVSVERVKRTFNQGTAGVRVSFMVSNNLIGKTDKATHEALSALLPDENE